MRRNAEAAIQFEKLGNQLAKIYDVDILCGYSLGSVEIDIEDHIFQQICAETPLCIRSENRAAINWRIWIQRNEAVLRACQHIQAVAICNSITLLLT
jgi:hypothetical protein